MGKPAFRYIAYGECPKCGSPIIRKPEITVGVCTCESAIKVPLNPTLLFRTSSRLYRKIQKIAGMFDVSVKALVSKVYETVLSDKEFMVEAINQLRGNKQ
jgi:hypothetical protein